MPRLPVRCGDCPRGGLPLAAKRAICCFDEINGPPRDVEIRAKLSHPDGNRAARRRKARQERRT